MTAYSRSEISTPIGELCCEMQSLNKRFLELHVSLPRELSHLEVTLRKWVADKVGRGKLNIYLFWKSGQEALRTYEPNAAIIESLSLAVEKIALQAKLSESHQKQLLVDLLSKERDLFCVEASSQDDELDFVSIEPLLKDCLVKHKSMQEKEGAFLKQDLQKRLVKLKTAITAIEKFMPKAPEVYRQRLLDRLSGMNLELDLNDERLIKELSFFTEKSDISEEVTRFFSHLEQFTALLDKQEDTIGKKLDFIVQELFREANTISAKSFLFEVSTQALEMKTELERVREQVQNIE